MIQVKVVTDVNIKTVIAETTKTVAQVFAENGIAFEGKQMSFNGDIFDVNDTLADLIDEGATTCSISVLTRKDNA